MTVSVYRCANPDCDEPLVMQGHNGAVYISPRHFHYEYRNLWYCNEQCCEHHLRMMSDGTAYDERNDPDAGSGDMLS